MARWPHLRGKYLGVLGRIAAGKSTLLATMGKLLRADRPDDRIKVLSEYFPVEVFENYKKDPHLIAEPFQTIMAAFAATRDFWARDLLADFPSATAISERPLPENYIFFKNNIDAGFIKEDYHPNYHTVVRQFSQFAPDVMVYLHVTYKRSVDRMLKRADKDPSREAERSYDAGYLKGLGTNYFDFIVRHLADQKQPPILVIDWNHEVDMDNEAEYEAVVALLLDKLDAYFAAGRPAHKFKMERFQNAADDELAASTGEVVSCVFRKPDGQPVPFMPQQIFKLHDFVLGEIAADREFTLCF